MTVRLYQVVVAFVAVTAAFALGLWSLSREIETNRRSITRDAALAVLVRETQLRTITLREAQIAGLKAAALASCESRHEIVAVIDGILKQSIDSAKTHHIPGATAEQQAAFDQAVVDGIALEQAGRVALRKADCTYPPKIPQSPKKKKK